MFSNEREKLCEKNKDITTNGIDKKKKNDSFSSRMIFNLKRKKLIKRNSMYAETTINS